MSFFPNSNQALLTPLTSESLHLLLLLFLCLLSPSPYPPLWALDLRPDLSLFLRPIVFSQFLSPSPNHHHSISYLCQPRPTGGQGHRGHLGSWQEHEYHVQGQERFTLPCSQPPPPLPGPLQPPSNPDCTFLAPQTCLPRPLRTLQ